MTDASPRLLRVFLCHSSGDKPIVRELYQKLSSEGWLDVWLDEAKLLPGQEWDLEIEKAVEGSDIVLVCLSNQSIDKEGYLQKELRFVLNIADEKPEGSIFVVPLRLNDCIVPRRLRGWQYVDYFPQAKRETAYQRLLESLRVRATGLSISAQPPKDSPVPRRSTIKTDLIGKYGRLASILLLTLGFFIFWDSRIGVLVYLWLLEDPFVQLIPLAVGAFFLIGLIRLFSWKSTAGKTLLSLERLTAGAASLALASAFVVLGHEAQYLWWGFWLSNLGVWLTAAVILYEMQSTLKEGQTWPRWAWVLTISVILPWIIFYFLFSTSLWKVFSR